TGEFYLPEYAFHGMIECPCMVFLEVEGQVCKKAVLMISMDISEDASREFRKFPDGCKPHTRLMQYLVGDFDGEVFIGDKTADGPQLVDCGMDFYAGTVFANCKETILMAWLGNSEASMKIPTEEEGFRGILSFPRKLSLVKSGDGFCLKQSFFADRIEGTDGVRYIVDQDGERLTDHCVSERITQNGTRVYTDYLVNEETELP
ncbi:MAG: hypothetical protein IK078_09205, partial [Lachnospiraceae bacterium]|nr:hypothetical protein [Lachnospiraceae bacterium]